MSHITLERIKITSTGYLFPLIPENLLKTFIDNGKMLQKIEVSNDQNANIEQGILTKLLGLIESKIENQPFNSLQIQLLQVFKTYLLSKLSINFQCEYEVARFEAAAYKRIFDSFGKNDFVDSFGLFENCEVWIFFNNCFEKTLGNFANIQTNPILTKLADHYQSTCSILKEATQLSIDEILDQLQNKALNPFQMKDVQPVMQMLINTLILMVICGYKPQMDIVDNSRLEYNVDNVVFFEDNQGGYIPYPGLVHPMIQMCNIDPEPKEFTKRHLNPLQFEPNQFQHKLLSKGNVPEAKITQMLQTCCKYQTEKFLVQRLNKKILLQQRSHTLLQQCSSEQREIKSFNDLYSNLYTNVQQSKTTYINNMEQKKQQLSKTISDFKQTDHQVKEEINKMDEKFDLIKNLIQLIKQHQLTICQLNVQQFQNIIVSKRKIIEQKQKQQKLKDKLTMLTRSKVSD